MNARIAACALMLCALPLRAQNTSPQSPAQQPTTQTRSSASEQSTIDPAKAADIRKLQELRGDKQNAAQVMDTMLKTLRPLMTKALPPGDYRDKLIELFVQKLQTKDLSQAILDAAVPIYDKYLSDDDIKSLIQFYESPVGRKLAAVTPALMAELQGVGEKQGEEEGRQTMLEVLAENPDLEQDLEAAGKATKTQ